MLFIFYYYLYRLLMCLELVKTSTLVIKIRNKQLNSENYFYSTIFFNNQILIDHNKSTILMAWFTE